MELGPCHSPGSKNCEVAPTLFGNLQTPGPVDIVKRHEYIQGWSYW